MHAQDRHSHLCFELASFPVFLIECQGKDSQNGLLSDKTSACCFSSCQQHCTIFGNLLKTLLNQTCGSFLELLKWKLIQNVVVFKLVSIFCPRPQNGNIQTSSNILFKLTLWHPPPPIALWLH